MSFTALHADHGRLDATVDGLGCGLPFAAIHRARPRASLTCTECRHGMHAKKSSGGLQFFAHDAHAPRCAAAGESLEHHLFKLELAHAARAAGHHAELEVRAPGGRWRADVLVTAPASPRRVALEAQMSPLTLAEVRERTRRYLADNIDVIWFTTRPQRWSGQVPAVPVLPPQSLRTRWKVSGAVITRFVFEDCYCDPPWTHADHNHWSEAAEPVPLRTFIAGVLQRQLLQRISASTFHDGTATYEGWAPSDDLRTEAETLNT
ncbi:competence protein CoiA family protein [Streptomyces lydicus]|uniref:competence protein CoiA family protein n=1 Tax=Streptomyces lydicus TaxID=47763 RepID=UPI0010129B1C|nr:competence protein CoiA family protein [Streptomyces lydicus]MCZ1011930.1 competence protein CoiA family protein [Streptomyces lydicus]